MRKRELERRLAEAEQRFYDWQSTVPPYGRAYLTSSGTPATVDSSTGLPAASAAIRLTSETLGMMPLKVYRGDPPNRDVARDTWQWERLHDAPNDEQSAFEFWSDVNASVETAGNAYIWKAVTRRPVSSPDDIQLLLRDPGTVSPRWEGGRKMFDVWEDGKKTTYTSSRILHVRGFALTPGAAAGLSPISWHRESFGKYLATEEFESRFFANGARPSGVIQVPGTPREGEVDELKRLWFERYGGLSNVHTPAVLTNGATWQPTGINLQDAQFIDQKRYSGEDIARIFRISSLSLLGVFVQGVAPPRVDDAIDQFLQIDMGPRIDRVQQALANDADLFPSRELFPEFLAEGVLRPSIQTRYAAYKDALQAGWMTGNEVRERENLPAHPDGESLQQTPVGGAPNAPKAATNGQGTPQSVGSLPTNGG